MLETGARVRLFSTTVEQKGVCALTELEPDPSVRLPVVTLQASLREAFDAMRLAGRSGVVAADGEGHFLFLVSDIIEGLATGSAQTLADLGTPHGALDSRHLSDGPSPGSFPGGRAAGGARESWPAPRIYALVSTENHSVQVATSFKALHAELESSPTDCYCLVGKERVPNGRTGGDCKRKRHGSQTVYCVK